MKQFFLGIVLLLCCYSNGFGQFQIHPDSSFFTFLDSFYTRYQDDGTEGGIYNQVRRDLETWGTRLAPSGQMSKATRALTEYTKVYNGTPPTPSSGTATIEFPLTHPIDPAWDELGPKTLISGGGAHQGIGQIHRLAFHPDYDGLSNQTIYAGSHFGGLYRTDDGGANWYNYHTDRGISITSVADVAVSSDEVFICTGNGDFGYSNFGFNVSYSPLGPGRINDSNPIHTQGVYMNIVGTNTWTGINGVGTSGVTMIDNSLVDNLLTVFAEGGTMRNIIVNPNGDDTLHIATSQGVFRSTNKGANWRQVLVGPSNGSGGYIWDTEWRGLEYHPTNRNIMYASGSKDIYKSIDGGLTWNTMTANLSNLNVSFTIERINIAVTPAAPDYVYAYVVSKGESEVYLYNGTTWSLQANIAVGEPSWMAIAVSPINSQHVFVGHLDIYESTNINPGGLGSFSKITDTISLEVHDDVHELAFSPTGNATELFAATHGGVSKYNTTTGWEALYNGLGVATIWAFDDWEGNDSLIAIALQDNGIFHTDDNAQSWIGSAEIGDGYGVRIDDHTGTLYLKYNTYNGLRRRGNAYLNIVNPELIAHGEPIDIFRPLDNGISGGGALIPNTFPMVNHPKNEKAYLGFSELYHRNKETYEYKGTPALPTVDSLLMGKSVYAATDTLTLITLIPGIGLGGASCVDIGGGCGFTCYVLDTPAKWIWCSLLSSGYYLSNHAPRIYF